MKSSEKLDKLLPKLLIVKNKLEAITKGSNNPFYKSKYADLNTHLDAVEPLLQAQGLLLFQPCSTTDLGQNRVESMIIDTASGQFMSSEMTLIGEKDMQKAGSAITYGRRYTIGSLLSMKAEDDDGNLAAGKTVPKKTSTASPKTLPSSSSKSTSTTKSSRFRTPKTALPKIPNNDAMDSFDGSSTGDDW